MSTSLPVLPRGLTFHRPPAFADAPHTAPAESRRGAVDIGLRPADPLSGPAARRPGLPPVYITENGSAEVEADADADREPAQESR